MSIHEPIAESRRTEELESNESARVELEAIARHYGRPVVQRWTRVPEALDRAIAMDRALAAAAHRARVGLLREVSRRLMGLLPAEVVARYMDALLAVPRERFVLPEDIALSVDDVPLPLDRAGLSTVSAPHAYLLTYALLRVSAGDHVLELGTGTGYGAALARSIVGSDGHVISIEIDPMLAERARRLIDLSVSEGRESGITLFHGDAKKIAPTMLRGRHRDAPPLRVAITYALRSAPEWLLELLPDEATLIAPVGKSLEQQELVRWEKRAGSVRCSAHGTVRYVTERH